MTQKDKELLLKDLCARLPYHPIVRWTCDGKELDEELKHLSELQIFWITRSNNVEVKPYLRPMSSMTEEEKEICKHYKHDIMYEGSGSISFYMTDYIDWLNKNHFDWRDNGNNQTMIESGLALEATHEIYPELIKEEEPEIFIPTTVEEAITNLDEILSSEDKEWLFEAGALVAHTSLGRWIRNEWGLWEGSELKDNLTKLGFSHPDDMSNYIIEEYIKRFKK